MLKDIVEVKPQPNYQLALTFEDGVSGVLDISQLIEFVGVFELLEDPDYFQQVELNAELGVVCWPNGADLDPDVLYSQITGDPIDIKSFNQVA